MPFDEPSKFGFTMTGKAMSSSAPLSIVARVTSRARGVGTP